MFVTRMSADANRVSQTAPTTPASSDNHIPVTGVSLVALGTASLAGGGAMLLGRPTGTSGAEVKAPPAVGRASVPSGHLDTFGDNVDEEVRGSTEMEFNRMAELWHRPTRPEAQAMADANPLAAADVLRSKPSAPVASTVIEAAAPVATKVPRSMAISGLMQRIDKPALGLALMGVGALTFFAGVASAQIEHTRSE